MGETIQMSVTNNNHKTQHEDQHFDKRKRIVSSTNDPTFRRASHQRRTPTMSESKNAEKEADESTKEAADTSANTTRNGTASTPEKSIDNITRAAARGTLFTLILRLISFACTQLTIRALDPSTLGTNIQLELLLTTVLFISREGFRLALTQNVVPENWTVGSLGTREKNCSRTKLYLLTPSSYFLPMLAISGSLADHSCGYSCFGIHLGVAFAIRNIR
mmetsp:Transcript_2515/g.5860  ORF Transcript_2515/g.5860 Transcript_2515/m.5860 type:complete len:219 (+) Transcript_2515:30-686(+)